MIDELQNEQKIIGGDLNLVLDLEKDKQGGRYTTNKNAAEFVKTNLQIEDLIDNWRFMNPECYRYTGRRTNPTLVMVHLDYLLISSSLL